jgi:hypothetical protein
LCAALDISCITGHFTIMASLIFYGAPLKSNSPRGTHSPLRLAAMYGHADCVRYLLGFMHGKMYEFDVSIAKKTAISFKREECISLLSAHLIEVSLPYKCAEMENENTDLVFF